MRIGAVIAEYNPFHNGHEYQLADFRKKCSLDSVVVCMSGCFVQRGEPAICNKYKRAEWALRGGADMVIELPVYYSCANANCFARGGVGLVSDFADFLGFGAETEDLELLRQCAEIDTSSVRDNESGKSYPRAVYEWVTERFGENVARAYANPNSTLAIEYIRAANELCSDMQLHITKRIGAAHNDIVPSGITASASSIREMLKNGDDIRKYVPGYVKTENAVTLKDMDMLLLYSLRNMPKEELAGIADVREGMENLIKKAAYSVTSYEQLLKAVKTKRYTMARLKRIGIAALLGITDADTGSAPEYIHVLGVRADTKDAICAEITRRTDRKIILKGSDYKKCLDNSFSLLKKDLFATDTYSLFCNELPSSDLSNKLLII